MYSLQPIFRWSYGDARTHFQFTLKDDSLNEVFKTDTKEPLLEYPESAPQLEAGKTYFWIVEPIESIFSEPRSRSGLLLYRLSSERRSMQNSRESHSAKARAEIFTKYRLWYDTLDAYQAAISARPESPELLRSAGRCWPK